MAGVGIEMGKTEPGPFTFTSVTPGGAAALCGLIAEGDMLHGVGETPVYELNWQQTMELMQGPAGSDIVLWISQARNEGEPNQPIKRLKLKRKLHTNTFPANGAEYLVGGRVGCRQVGQDQAAGAAANQVPRANRGRPLPKKPVPRALAAAPAARRSSSRVSASIATMSVLQLDSDDLPRPSSAQTSMQAPESELTGFGQGLEHADPGNPPFRDEIISLPDEIDQVVADIETARESGAPANRVSEVEITVPSLSTGTVEGAADVGTKAAARVERPSFHLAGYALAMSQGCGASRQGNCFARKLSNDAGGTTGNRPAFVVLCPDFDERLDVHVSFSVLDTSPLPKPPVQQPPHSCINFRRVLCLLCPCLT